MCIINLFPPLGKLWKMIRGGKIVLYGISTRKGVQLYVGIYLLINILLSYKETDSCCVHDVYFKFVMKKI